MIIGVDKTYRLVYGRNLIQTSPCSYPNFSGFIFKNGVDIVVAQTIRISTVMSIMIYSEIIILVFWSKFINSVSAGSNPYI